MTAYPRRPSYSIFVRFRRSRLALRRGIARVEDALAIAESRANRFHDQGDVFVVKEPEGTLIELPPVATQPATAQPAATQPAATEPAGLPALAPPSAAPAPAGSEPTPAPTAPDPLRAPRLPQRATRPPVAARELASILRMMDQVRRFDQVMERAQAAQARLERASSTAERAIESHPGGLPAALSRTRERLAAACASAARTVGSFERAGAVVARRLEIARTDVGGAP